MKKLFRCHTLSLSSSVYMYIYEREKTRWNEENSVRLYDNSVTERTYLVVSNLGGKI